MMLQRPAGNVSSFSATGLGMAALVMAMWLSLAQAQSVGVSRDSLLQESEYRSELEEVVVVGQAPEWRKPAAQEEWRPERFELKIPDNEARMEWFPEYIVDERDQYQGVRDRTGEKAEFQLFKWRF